MVSSKTAVAGLLCMWLEVNQWINWDNRGLNNCLATYTNTQTSIQKSRYCMIHPPPCHRLPRPHVDTPQLSTVNFPATEHHCPLDGIVLADRGLPRAVLNRTVSESETATSRSRDRRSTTTLLRHTEQTNTRNKRKTCWKCYWRTSFVHY